jgi:hypothetical protein
MPSKKKWDISWHNGTTLGFHLTLNPQPALPPTVGIYRQFLEHGIVVSDRELESIMAGREEGVRTINNILNNGAPSLGSSLSLKLSNDLADALLDKSLKGQLSREFPTSLERLEERDEKMKSIYNRLSPPPANTGFLPQLLQSLPPVGVGFSLTIYFDFPN